MKRVLKIFYILIILVALGASLCKETKLLKEVKVLRDEKISRKELILKDIDENYKPRQEDFYKEESKKK